MEALIAPSYGVEQFLLDLARLGIVCFLTYHFTTAFTMQVLLWRQRRRSN